MSLNKVIRFALSDAGATDALGINLTNTEINAKTEAGVTGLLVRGSNAVDDICHDYSGNMYVTDANKHCVLRVDEGGKISLFAGLPGTAGDVLGVNQSARFNGPRGIACDKSGNIYVADAGNNKIKIIARGSVSLVAGSTSGLTDGVGSAAKFKNPIDLTIDNSGILYVVDSGNHAIRKITDGNVLTIAGNGSSGDAENVEANGQTATFSSPSAIAVDPEGNLYVLDNGNRKIKKIVPRGQVFLHSGDGTSGRSLGTAPSFAYTCSYENLRDCDVDESGNLYVLDVAGSNNSRLIKVDYSGKPGVIHEFNGTSSNKNLQGVICTPGQKILVTVTDTTVGSSSSSQSSSSSSSSSSTSSASSNSSSSS